MKGMDLGSALAAPVQGRGSGQGARSRPEAGNTAAESFDTVFNDVHGAAATAHRPTDDAGAGSAGDGTAQGTNFGSAAAQNPAAGSGTDGAASAESAGQDAGQVAGGPTDQPTPLAAALGLPVQDVQAPSVAPTAAGSEAATPWPDPRLAVPGALLAPSAQQAALQVEAPGTAQAPGLQPTAVAVSGLGAGVPATTLAAPGAVGGASAANSTVPVSGLGAGVPAAAPAAGGVPAANSTAVPVSGLGAGVPATTLAAPAAAGGVLAANSTTSTFTPQGFVAEQTLAVGATSGSIPGVASGTAETSQLAAPATGMRSTVVPGDAPAPVTAPTTAAAPPSTTTASTAAPALPPANAATAGSAAAFPAAALAESVTSGTVHTGDTAAAAPTTPAPAAPADALGAAGTAVAAAVPANQPTSSAAAAPLPAAPAVPQQGATLQPQLAKPLFTLAGAPQGQHIMTLQVAPEDLGPMTVRAHIDAAGVRIELFAPGDAGREAIRGVLPELRKELAEAGFGASLDVSDHSGPGTPARDGTGQDSTSQDGAARDSGSGPGNRNGPGDPRPGHRWDALADGDALRDARILNGPQTTLDILV